MPSILNATTTSGLVTSADNSGSLQLQTNNGTTAVTIDTSQNVGIGTTSPASNGKLSVESNGSASSEINISLINGISNKECIVNFGKNLATADRYLGRIYYQVDNNIMGFWTNTTERMRIDSSGRVTTPNQPAFMAHLNNSITNGSPQTLVFDGTQFNTGSHYSTSTGRFTAPITGLYQFNVVILVQGGSATMHDFSLQVNGSFYKNGRIYAPDSTVNYACAIRLNANDYVSVYVTSTGRTLYGTSDWSYFSGFLVG